MITACVTMCACLLRTRGLSERAAGCDAVSSGTSAAAAARLCRGAAGAGAIGAIKINTSNFTAFSHSCAPHSRAAPARACRVCSVASHSTLGERLSQPNSLARTRPQHTRSSHALVVGIDTVGPCYPSQFISVGNICISRTVTRSHTFLDCVDGTDASSCSSPLSRLHAEQPAPPVHAQPHPRFT